MTNEGFNAVEDDIKRLGRLNLFGHLIYIPEHIIVLLFLILLHHLQLLLLQKSFLGSLLIYEFLKACNNLFEYKVFRVDCFDLREIVLSCFNLDNATLMRKRISQVFMNSVYRLLLVNGQLLDFFFELAPHFFLDECRIFVIYYVYRGEVH